MNWLQKKKEAWALKTVRQMATRERRSVHDFPFMDVLNQGRFVALEEELKGTTGFVGARYMEIPSLGIIEPLIEVEDLFSVEVHEIAQAIYNMRPAAVLTFGAQSGYACGYNGEFIEERFTLYEVPGGEL